MSKRLIVIWRGTPYLLDLKRCRRNFRKYARGRIPQREIIAGGILREVKDIETMIRNDVRRINGEGQYRGQSLLGDVEGMFDFETSSRS